MARESMLSLSVFSQYGSIIAHLDSHQLYFFTLRGGGGGGGGGGGL